MKIMRIGTLCIVVLSLLLTSCATWSRHGIVLDPPRKIRIAVLPITNAVKIKKLKTIQSSPKAAHSPIEEKELIIEKMQQVTEEITNSIEKELAVSYFFEVVPHQKVHDTMVEMSIGSSTLSSTQIKELGRALDTDTLLFTQLSGYGKIKKKWLVFLIGSGLIEGTVQGIAAAAVADTIWVAVGIAVEEALQEGLTWGGGAFLFNKIFTPVILESELVSTMDGKAIWDKTSFVRINRKALKAYPKEDRKKKELRLRLTSEKASEELIRHLDKIAWRNVKSVLKSVEKASVPAAMEVPTK